PFGSLSREDQQYLRGLLAARGEGHLCPRASEDIPKSPPMPPLSPPAMCRTLPLNFLMAVPTWRGQGLPAKLRFMRSRVLGLDCRFIPVMYRRKTSPRRRKAPPATAM